MLVDNVYHQPGSLSSHSLMSASSSDWSCASWSWSSAGSPQSAGRCMSRSGPLTFWRPTRRQRGWSSRRTSLRTCSSTWRSNSKSMTNKTPLLYTVLYFFGVALEGITNRELLIWVLNMSKITLWNILFIFEVKIYSSSLFFDSRLLPAIACYCEFFF